MGRFRCVENIERVLELKVTLLSPLGGGGEGTYVKELLAHPPKNVFYTHYPDSSPFPLKVVSSAFSFSRRKLLYPDATIKMLKTKEETDLIHVHAVANKIKSKSPIVMSASSSSYVYLKDYLGWSEEKIQRRYRLGKGFYKLFNINDRLLNLDNVKHLIVWSNFAKGIYLKFGIPEEKVSVVYPGMPLRRSKRTETENEIRFLFIGDLNRKGGSLVLKSFKKLMKNYDNIRLTVVTSETEKVLKNKNINCKYFMEREALFDEVFPFHDVFLLPTYKEGFGITIEEAMSFGMPVISTNINAIPELVENEKTGFLIEPGNLQELTEKMQILIDDKELRRKMRKNTIERFKNKFWYERTNKELYKVYERSDISS